MYLDLKKFSRFLILGEIFQKIIEVCVFVSKVDLYNSPLDLYGLFVFLGVEPYWVHFWWTELLYKPFCHGQKEALFTVLTETLWRTAKKDVLDQVSTF